MTAKRRQRILAAREASRRQQAYVQALRMEHRRTSAGIAR